MQAWHLIYSKPQQERVALENLLRQRYDVYLPLLRRRNNRRAIVTEPLFLRYLFIFLCDETDDWGPIRSTHGVMRIIRFGQTPARVPTDFVETLRAQETGEGVHVVAEPGYRPGDSVRIAEGSMAGYDAVFAARASKERVLLLLNIAGKEARVQLRIKDIKPADAYR